MTTPQRFAALVYLTLTCLAAGTATGQSQLGRVKRWVRSHPFTTMALTILADTYDPLQYRAANLNTTLAWKERSDLLQESTSANLPWHVHLRSVVLRDAGLTDEIKARLKKLYNTHPGCTGWLVWDEPKRPEMFEAAGAIAWLKQTYPDTLVYSNAYPRGATLERYYGGELPPGGYSYEQYLRDFAKIMDPDVLMFDMYIFRQSGGTGNPFPTMMDARKIGRETGKPFWAFVQSHSDDRRGYRMPSESDIRMQVFSHLTVGFTGIAYFTYEDQQGPAMISNGARQRRPIYYHVARLNQEVIHVGQALRFLETVNVWYLPGDGNKLPAATQRWPAGQSPIPALQSIRIEGSSAPWRDLLIGAFRDDAGHTYMMLTNLWHAPQASAAQRTMTVSLKLNSAIKTVGRLSRETGRPESLSVDDGELQLTLPGGTGELLRLGDARFPGLDASP